jgi:hypothetical protein
MADSLFGCNLCERKIGFFEKVFVVNTVRLCGLCKAKFDAEKAEEKRLREAQRRKERCYGNIISKVRIGS